MRLIIATDVRMYRDLASASLALLALEKSRRGREEKRESFRKEHEIF